MSHTGRAVRFLRGKSRDNYGRLRQLNHWRASSDKRVLRRKYRDHLEHPERSKYLFPVSMLRCLAATLKLLVSLFEARC